MVGSGSAAGGRVRSGRAGCMQGVLIYHAGYKTIPLSRGQSHCSPYLLLATMAGVHADHHTVMMLEVLARPVNST